MRGIPYYMWTVVVLAGCSFQPAGGANGTAEPTSPDAGPSVEGADAGDKTPTDPDAAPAVSGVLESREVETGPTLDSEIEELWMQAEPIDFDVSDAMQTFQMHPDYGWDGSVRFRSLHDDDNLYFLFEVKDTLLIDDSDDAYEDDAIELYLDGNGDGSGPYGEDDHWLVIQSSGLYQSFGENPLALAGSVVANGTGYVIEISIPREDMGNGPSGTLGFNIGLVDDDGLGDDAAADAYGLWFVPSGPHCAECCDPSEGSQAWCDTSMLGSIELID